MLLPETSNGMNPLTGDVRCRADIDKAVEGATGVKGVKTAKNDRIFKETQ